MSRLLTNYTFLCPLLFSGEGEEKNEVGQVKVISSEDTPL